MALGRHSSEYILEKAGAEFTNISEARGKILRKKVFGITLKIMPTFHPAASLYNGIYKKGIEEDFRKIGKTIL